jgi:hypothetical protein
VTVRGTVRGTCEGCGRPIRSIAYQVSIPGRVLKLHDHPCLRQWLAEHAEGPTEAGPSHPPTEANGGT